MRKNGKVKTYPNGEVNWAIFQMLYINRVYVRCSGC